MIQRFEVSLDGSALADSRAALNGWETAQVDTLADVDTAADLRHRPRPRFCQ